MPTAPCPLFETYGRFQELNFQQFSAELPIVRDYLASFPAVPLPTQEQADAAALSGQPLLLTASWPRDAAWRTEWRALLGHVLGKLPPDSPARASVEAVRALPDDALERQADRLLAGISLGVDLAAAPLIAAGLQLYWTHLVSATAAQPNATHDIPCE